MQHQQDKRESSCGLAFSCGNLITTINEHVQTQTSGCNHITSPNTESESSTSHRWEINRLDRDFSFYLDGANPLEGEAVVKGVEVLPIHFNLQHIGIIRHTMCNLRESSTRGVRYIILCNQCFAWPHRPLRSPWWQPRRPSLWWGAFGGTPRSPRSRP